MKKSLIALAVAGVFAAPALAATGNVDVYGKVRASIDNASISGANNGGWLISDRVSRIGLKGTEDLGGGMKAVWQIENQLAFDGAGTLGGGGLRNTFVGLNADFGTVLVGRHDTPYKLAGSADLFADTIADSQCAAPTAAGTFPAGSACIIGRSGFDQRAAQILAYISPTWSGFSFSAGVMPGEELNAPAAVPTVAAHNDANGLMDSYSLGASYTNGPIKVTAAYENYDGKTILPVGTAAGQDMAAWKINGSYKIGDIGLGLTYEKSDDSMALVGEKEDTGILASVSYGMGPITLAGQYGKFDQKDPAATKNMDLTSWVVGATYALSKRTNVYALYHSNNWGKSAVVPAPMLDVKHVSFGMNHDF